MKHARVVIQDLFLAQSIAANVCAGLQLPALEKILGRSTALGMQTHSLDVWLCREFAIPELAIAPVTLMADGVSPEEAYWMRADPVHLRLDNAKMILQTNVSPSLEEAQQLCKSLNLYFAELGMIFFAPHPQRWYVRLEEDPQLTTHSVQQVEGRDSRLYFPQGSAALKWHGKINEIQMSLYVHSINQGIETRGGLPITSVWLWGGGRAATLAQPFTEIVSDSELVYAFAQASRISHSYFPGQPAMMENALYVWEGTSVAMRRGDFDAWRQSVINFEQYCLQPLLASLSSGALDKLTLDVIQDESSTRFELTRAKLWKFWAKPKALASYALV